jgi:hypothetical protein
MLSFVSNVLQASSMSALNFFLQDHYRGDIQGRPPFFPPLRGFPGITEYFRQREIDLIRWFVL